MKIAFIWYWDRASEIYEHYRDGLRGAMDVIDKDHKVDWYLDKSMPEPGNYDFLLFWSSSQEDYFKDLYKYPEKKGLCLTTNPHNHVNLRNMSAIYCESDVVYDEVRAHGLRAIKAFGTDTDFFTPDEEVRKDIEYFYPATFSPWKRQSEIAHLGKKLVCMGTVQPDGQAEYDKCVEEGVVVKEGYFPVDILRNHYRRTKKIRIPAVHGSERTMVEAMSMNILPKVLHPNLNAKTYTYYKEFMDSGYKKPRDFILENYSHRIYAQNILKGME
jgi:hypothetical protein